MTAGDETENKVVSVQENILQKKIKLIFKMYLHIVFIYTESASIQKDK